MPQPARRLRRRRQSPLSQRIELSAHVFIGPDRPRLQPTVGPALRNETQVGVALQREADGVDAMGCFR